MVSQPNILSGVPEVSAGRLYDSTPGHAVLRVKRQCGTWEPVPHALINDPRLGFDTRGFAAWLMAKPPNWQIRPGSLPHLLEGQCGPIGDVGRDTIRRYLRELQNAGYLTRIRYRTPAGHWIWDIEFSVVAQIDVQAPATIDGSAVDGSPVDGSAVDGQGVDISHTQNQDIRDKEILNSPSSDPDRDFDSVVDKFDIQFPEFLQGQFRRAAEKLMESCPWQHRQAVLAAMIAINAKDGIQSPLGLLRTLIERAKEGYFNPKPPNSYQRQQERRREESSERKSQLEHRQQQPPANLVPVSEIGRQILAKLRKQFPTPATDDAHGSKDHTQ